MMRLFLLSRARAVAEPRIRGSRRSGTQGRPPCRRGRSKYASRAIVRPNQTHRSWCLFYFSPLQVCQTRWPPQHSRGTVESCAAEARSPSALHALGTTALRERPLPGAACAHAAPRARSAEDAVHVDFLPVLDRVRSSARVVRGEPLRRRRGCSGRRAPPPCTSCSRSSRASSPTSPC